MFLNQTELVYLKYKYTIYIIIYRYIIGDQNVMFRNNENDIESICFISINFVIENHD